MLYSVVDLYWLMVIPFFLCRWTKNIKFVCKYCIIFIFLYICIPSCSFISCLSIFFGSILLCLILFYWFLFYELGAFVFILFFFTRMVWYVLFSWSVWQFLYLFLYSKFRSNLLVHYILLSCFFIYRLVFIFTYKGNYHYFLD